MIFLVAGTDKRAALKALVARNPESIASRAVAGCANVEIWADRDAWPPATHPGPSWWPPKPRRMADSTLFANSA